MAKNILLTFLSKVGVNPKDKKVRRTPYNGIGETYMTNESAIRYLLNSNGLDRIFLFVSNVVLNDFVGAEDAKDITHYNYFKNRLNELKLDVENLLTEESVYPYDEMQLPETVSESATWKSMGQIVEMASRIQSYVQAQSEEVILHVDCTGGPRDVAMMIISILRLMEYQGVTIGKILYSNFERHTVDEANDIYDMFNLIAGAEEFVRFGSVEAILSYFNNKDIPKELEELLKAMKNFAEAIKISRRKEFHDALQGLQDAYKKFSDAEKDFSTVDTIPSLNYNLMQQLKIRIAKEYSTLLECSADDYVSIIDWCLDHGYIQQALVLYTESFPYMIIAKDKLIDVDSKDAELIRTLKKKISKDKMKRGREFLILNEFCPEKYNGVTYNSQVILNVYDDFVAQLKIAIQSIRSGTFNMDDFKKDVYSKSKDLIKSDYEDYLELLRDLEKLKDNPNLVKDVETVADKLPTLYSFLNLIAENIFEIPEKCRGVKILKRLENMKCEDFRKKFNNTLELHHRIKSGVLVLNKIDEENFLEIIDRYFMVKSARNDSVHALQIPKELLGSSDAGTSYAALLKQYMKDGIQEYSRVIKKIKG